MSILILSGQSGSGKSTALHVLEDEGYFCVDNLPFDLLWPLIDHIDQHTTHKHVAVVIDGRDRNLSQHLVAFGELMQKPQRHQFRLMFFRAQNQAVLMRYSQTRRKHPFDDGCGLEMAIAAEQKVLAPLVQLANDSIDTSDMSPHRLKTVVIAALGGHHGFSMVLQLVSFGYKYGLPKEADVVFDVRFLPNPYFNNRLAPLSGLDEPVAAYVNGLPDTSLFVQQTAKLLQFLVPRYQQQGKRYLTVAVGCTGGRHRSVAVVGSLRQSLPSHWHATLRHRDIHKEL